MRFSISTALVVTLAAQVTANSWFGSAVYDKWHETELERWLTDHGVPHPSPSDRKNLQTTVKANWNDKVVNPYQSWDTQALTDYLTLKGQQVKKGTEKDVKSLAEQVQGLWTETEDSANQAYSSVRDWIFDSWSDSQLKAFADKNGIPVPQPRQRDSLIRAVRDNYQSAADTLKETAAYPGDWLYASWSDSDLKAWFDERGYKVPQPTTRDSLVAGLRRQSRLASLNAQGAYAAVSSSAAAAQQSLSDALLDSWSDSQIKEWADKNGVKVPQGSKRNELIALARKHRARLYGDSASATLASAYGAATTQAGNAVAGFAYYTNLVKQQFGLAAEVVTASGSSLFAAAQASATSLSQAAVDAASSASSLSGSAGKSASSLAASLSKQAVSAASEASKTGSSISAAAAASGSSLLSAASASATSLSEAAYAAAASASSLSGEAAKTASASASSLSKAYVSADLAASQSASSISSVASASAAAASQKVKDEL